jgi:EAL domain-containing protein (putative c-di-GMP-specific phosphodiesterase class I)
MAKVLLVDDMPEQLKAYQRLLRHHFDIVTACDGAAALDLLDKDTNIDVIVSDMSMPEMNGIDFFALAARVAPKATRIMLTGNTDMNATIDAINRGRVFRYLRKPCARQELIEAIEAGLNLHPPSSLGSQGDPVADAVAASAHQSLMVKRLQDALCSKCIRPHFQPIVDLETGIITGAEALARWQDQGEAWISPIIFIPLAEQSGLMPELGRTVLKAACQTAAAWRRYGFDGSVSVNVSTKQFDSGRVVDDVVEALKISDLPSEDLTLEITESVLIDDPTSMIQSLEELRSLGVSLAIDDFGTGYSSLAYLKYLPVDRLKIDRCFVKDIDCDERDLAFVRAMLELARKLELSVVAEGIERKEQRDVLMDLGCSLGQGYFFEKALDEVAFAKLISGDVTRGQCWSMEA